MADLLLRMKLLEKAEFSSLTLQPLPVERPRGHVLTAGAIAEVAEGFTRRYEIQLRKCFLRSGSTSVLHKRSPRAERC
ncbi:hypothetical protein AV530_000663 [Patagioenas fasciata monilis]|uniref:Uncharacterized protein n=1 Tax=Patagioenas fasciata monilis TaxID=372326 RepID=A0A1V4IG75_PATFA|nr:hypothetical protein AV530_000663 [Patagioenas fasciata monilis]